ncbi:unnamed protein product [Spirodela intermedia]|uniref:Uncharacterized protein n=1 Tax=Spirodela intermedia TaxID=51605 RepID=A0A7I8J613_SPIIN|nr:unnamed protein product [Spirodela intermedia]CAA6665687.1 unnamed protein product [Spirodela intermedia]
MEDAERETLFLVMEAVSSDRDWRVSNPDPCAPGSSWPGIECTGGRTAATFPSRIFSLPYLQSAFFFDCFRSHNTSLSIPPVLTTALQQLSLKSNPALTGSIPPQISSLRSLQVLTLSQNRLQGSIPESISSLTSLVHLDLSYNSLSGLIPSELMSGLRNLAGLDLSYNSLSGPIPASIGKMGSLQKLDLSSNSLTGAIPDSLQNLGALSFVALSSNKLKGPLPAGLPKLGNLQYFIMDDNPMAIELPSQLGDLLPAGQPHHPLPAEQPPHGVHPPGLGDLRRMYHLNLSRNMLRGVVPFDAAFLRRLGRNLDLSENAGLCVNSSVDTESTKLGVGMCGGDSHQNTSTMLQQQQQQQQTTSGAGAGAGPPVLLPAMWGLCRLLLF